LTDAGGTRRCGVTTAEVLAWHLRRYPQLEAADAYKLLHQGAFGPGHLLADPAAAQRRLVRELAGLEPADDEAPAEPIDPAGRLVRVNLRPLAGRNEAVAALAAALVRSAAEVRPDPARLAGRLAEAAAWLRAARPEMAGELERLAVEAGKQGYPARHHSRQYRLSYRPAYRVVLSRLWPGAGHPESEVVGSP